MKRSWTAAAGFLLILFLSGGLAEAIEVELWPETYFQLQQYRDVDQLKINKTRFTQYLTTNFYETAKTPNHLFFSSLRVDADLGHDYSVGANPDPLAHQSFAVLYAYYEWRRLADTADLTIGRQVLSDEMGIYPLDGVRVVLRRNWYVGLDLYSGMEVKGALGGKISSFKFPNSDTHEPDGVMNDDFTTGAFGIGLFLDGIQDTQAKVHYRLRYSGEVDGQDMGLTFRQRLFDHWEFYTIDNFSILMQRFTLLRFGTAIDWNWITFTLDHRSSRSLFDGDSIFNFFDANGEKELSADLYLAPDPKTHLNLGYSRLHQGDDHLFFDSWGHAGNASDLARFSVKRLLGEAADIRLSYAMSRGWGGIIIGFCSVPEFLCGSGVSVWMRTSWGRSSVGCFIRTSLKEFATAGFHGGFQPSRSSGSTRTFPSCCRATPIPTAISSVSSLFSPRLISMPGCEGKMSGPRKFWREALITAGFLFLAAVLSLPALGGEGEGFLSVYPPYSSTLIFSHKRHLKNDCLRCHAEIQSSSKSSDRNLPAETVCAACHAGKVRKSVNEPGEASRCGMCHADFDSLNKSRPARVNWPAPALKFPHDSHVMRMISCTTCHIGIEEATGSEARHLPKEGVCLKCHPKKEADGQNCERCHASEPSGEIATRAKGRTLVPGQGHLNHQRDWMKRHVEEAVHAPRSCEPCHQQRFCNLCHDGVKKPLKIHPEDYATMHPIDARKDQNRCSSCHRYQSFCLDCHKRMGLAEGVQRRPSPTRIHPAGFADCVRTPTHHSDQAKRSLLSCVACHTEGDCLKCHKSGSTCGGNVNIHGHLSNHQLTQMQKQNPRACKKCHANL